MTKDDQERRDTSAPAPPAGSSPFDGLPIRLTEQRDPLEVQREIMARMAAAQSLDELFAVHTGDSSKSLTGKRFEVREIDWDVYDAQLGPVPMAHVKALDLDSGELESWRTTAQNLTGFMAVAQQRGWLPFKAVIRSTKTKGGFDVQFFEPV